jgi:hypothetical protein
MQISVEQAGRVVLCDGSMSDGNASRAAWSTQYAIDGTKPGLAEGADVRQRCPSPRGMGILCCLKKRWRCTTCRWGRLFR